MVFIVIDLILCFARSSAYHQVHTVDTNDYLYYDILVVNAALLRTRQDKGRK